MHIAVIGAGRIGGNVARQLAAANHRVTLSFSRDPDRLRRFAEEIGGQAGEPADAVQYAEVVVLSVPWSLIPIALEQIGPLGGKVVIDTTNAFGPGPQPADGQTAAAFNAARMPGARYAKSFNTLTSAFQARTAHRQPPVVQWVCGTDAQTRGIVCDLVHDAGYEPVDLGGVENCQVMEAPRRAGAVYGEEYRLADAKAVKAAVAEHRTIPPTPVYDERR